MKSRMVTCIYNGLNRTELGGRLNRDRAYGFSLGAIARCGSDITCYTSSDELRGLQDYFIKTEYVNNIDFIPWELRSMHFHKDVMNIKTSKPNKYIEPRPWQDRCVHVMWGKFLFIKDTIKQYPDLDYVFWIDAGISHPGIIHSRFNPHYEHNIGFVEDLKRDTNHLTFKNALIFTEDFMDKLIAYTGDDKLLTIRSRGPQHQLIRNIKYKEGGSIIGGIFGGNTKLVDQYCDEMIALFEQYTALGELYTEEHLMTILASTSEIPFKTFTFDTWYHPDWEERYKSHQISFCDFFDKITVNYNE